MKTSFLTSGLVLGVALCLANTALAGEPGPAEMRERAAQLEEKARDLKAAGRHDDAQRVVAEIREIQQVLARMREERGGERDRGMAPPELRDRLGRVHRELERARAEGRADDVRGLEEKAGDLERALAERNRPAGARGVPRGDRPERGVSPERQEMAARRLEHLHIAMEHLRQAGLPEIAEQIAQRAEQLQRRLEGARRGQEEGRPLEVRIKEQFERVQHVLEVLNSRLERLEQEHARRHPEENREGR